jgi:hypothetical protein
LQLTRHLRTFGLTYGQPQSSNIFSRVDISIMFKPAMPTLKPLPVAIALPFFGVDMVTARTGLRRVRRWNQQQRNARNHSLVLHKQSKLIERPIIGTSSLSLASRFFVQAISNAAQVLEGQRRIPLLCFVDKLLADVVIEPFLKVLFSACEPSQKSSRIPSAFALNVCSNLTVSVANGLNCFAAPTVA